MWVRLNKFPRPNNHKIIWNAEIGITDRFLDDVGDVMSIERCSEMKSAKSSSLSCDTSKGTMNMNDSYKKSKRQTLKTGDDVLSIHWDAHFISSADELYHTTWETISDTTTIKSPLDGVLTDIVLEDPRTLDSDEVLFTMVADDEGLQRGISDFLHYDLYRDFVESSEQGKFYEADHST